MDKNLRTIKVLIWIGIVLFLFWFLISSLAPKSVLTTLDSIEIEGYFLRMFGILPLGWAILFFFVLKDIERNEAIIRVAIITADLMIAANVIYNYAVEKISSWFIWLSVVALFVYSSLLWIFKPKTS